MNGKLTTQQIQEAEFIVDRFNGVVPHLGFAYLSALNEAALCAHQNFTDLENNATNGTLKDHVLFDLFCCGLNYSAAVSRFFFPPKPLDKNNPLPEERAKRLREAFQVKDDSPIKNRVARNMIEHYDEKLDIFLLNPKAGTHIPTFQIVSISSLSKIEHIYRGLDPNTQECIILGEIIPYGTIWDEVLRIGQIAEQKLTSSGTI